MSFEPVSHCPICGTAAEVVRDLSAVEIRDQVSGLFDQPVPADVTFPDYHMRECQDCGLVYADPMAPGDGAYYGWITAQPKYHAGKRWEWGVIRNDFVAASGHLHVLEVGCGDGKLMDYVSDVNGLHMVGVDVSAPSIEKAKSKGHDARLSAFEDLNSVLSEAEMFDAVILSHVLEHVGDPLGVMQTVASRLKVGGAIYAALPYSPMSRELAGWDIQNLPPHHLTRWHQRSLQKLADILGLRLDLRLPKAKSPLKRAVQETCGEVLGNKHPNIWKRIGAVMAHPQLFFSWKHRFETRERVNGRAAGDSVLACFKKDN